MNPYCFRGIPKAAGACALVVLVCLAAAGSDLRAQTVTLIVTDSGTGAPVSWVQVAVRDGSRLISSTVTDQNGVSVIRLPAAGGYRLHLEHALYEALDTLVSVQDTREGVTIRVTLQKSVVRLDSLQVTARRRDPRFITGYDGLYARRAVARMVGTSRVVLKDDPEMRSTIRVSDVLKWFAPTKGCIVYLVNERPAPLMDIGNMSAGILEGVEFYKYHTDAPPHMRDLGCYKASSYSIVAVWLR